MVGKCERMALWRERVKRTNRIQYEVAWAWRKEGETTAVDSRNRPSWRDRRSSYGYGDWLVKMKIQSQTLIRKTPNPKRWSVSANKRQNLQPHGWVGPLFSRSRPFFFFLEKRENSYWSQLCWRKNITIFYSQIVGCNRSLQSVVCVYLCFSPL